MRGTVFKNMQVKCSNLGFIKKCVPYPGASPGFGRGGARIFFSDFGICMSQSDMLRMAKPCALLGGSGACSPEKIFLNDAIWCVLNCILIRFCLYFFLKNYHFFIYIYKKNFRYTLAMGYFS